MWDAAGRSDAKGGLRRRPTKEKRRWRSWPRSTRCLPVTDGFCGKCGAPMEPGCQTHRRSIAGSIARRRSNAAIGREGRASRRKIHVGRIYVRQFNSPKKARWRRCPRCSEGRRRSARPSIWSWCCASARPSTPTRPSRCFFNLSSSSRPQYSSSRNQSVRVLPNCHRDAGNETLKPSCSSRSP